jgi:3-oxoadipate enol-lactonase
MAQLSGDVLKMLDLLQIDKVNFVGLSLGGMIGQQFAIDHQDRLHSLVLCNTACEMPPPDLWNRCREIVLHEGMAGIAKDTLRYWFQPSFLRSNKQYPDLFREMILQNNIEGYIACITAIRDMNHAQMLFKIKCPTLIIAGKRDVMCTVHQARALNRFIEKSRLIILKDAAHISNIERPSEFAHAIMAFILEQGHTGMLSG